MDAKYRKEIALIRSLSSAMAADWIMEKYNPSSNSEERYPIFVLAHRSWKKEDQFRLARFYLKYIPFGNAILYDAFLVFMSIPNFINVIRENFPEKKEDIDLLLYYLEPSLRKRQKTNIDTIKVDDLIGELKQ